MKKAIKLLIMFWGVASVAIADENTKHFGAELDAFPYLTGGYYLSGWFGAGHSRVRAISAKVNIPDIAIKDGFKDNQLNAYALVVDYFPEPGFSGFWYGGGIELWDAEIKSSDENARAKYENYVLTAGGGYVWYFYKGFYLNPWGAIHGVVGGDKNVSVGSKNFKPDVISGEVSIKIGVKF